MNEQKKVVLYVVTYNRINFLKLALDSILKQTYSNFDVYVLDNCSKDETEQYVRTLRDKRVKYIRHTKNVGGIKNISYAFEHCEGEYFAIFHDDDILHQNLLEEEVSYLNNNEICVAVSCLANNIDEGGNYIKYADEANAHEYVFNGTNFFETYIHSQKSLMFPATLYRTDFIKKNRIKMSLDAGPCADVVIFMDIEKCGGVITEIPKALIDYRIYREQDSSSYLEEMLIQLMQYLSGEKYYCELLHKDFIGQKKYFRWYFERLLVRGASKYITQEEASTYLKRMYNVLDKPVKNIKPYEIILKSIFWFSPITNEFYKLVKWKRLRK